MAFSKHYKTLITDKAYSTSDMDFEGSELDLPDVCLPIKKALSEYGVKELTPIQIGTLPSCLEGMDCLAKAKTGTGKTLAFLIPTVERLVRSIVHIESFVAFHQGNM